MEVMKNESDLNNAIYKIAKYFANKKPEDIDFADADRYEYELFSILQVWNETFPNKSFAVNFPNVDKLWKTLGSWNYEDAWSREKCERIIELAKAIQKTIAN